MRLGCMIWIGLVGGMEGGDVLFWQSLGAGGNEEV